MEHSEERMRATPLEGPALYIALPRSDSVQTWGGEFPSLASPRLFCHVTSMWFWALSSCWPGR